MKIEITLTRHGVLRAITALLLVIFLPLLCSSPFYRYGRETSVFTPENGADAMLLGSWTLQSEENGQIGVSKINITGKRAMTVTKEADGQQTEEEGKVSYKEKTGALKLTFADGTVAEAVFLPRLSIDSVKTASLIGYAAYPYECDELTEEMTAYLGKNGTEFGYEKVVVPSVLMLIGILLSIVLLLVWHGKKKGLIPAIAIAAAEALALWLVPAFSFAMTGAKAFLSIWLLLAITAAAIDYIALGRTK
ncbi:MAG: hypothetical protein PHI27_03515 [Eubacteriales bacterium]|nr:hypothetical protein [Eubacteriales bacterium]MDD3881304.1 hypothetical protein [Eubacteriales bacterium]MDD4512222.1 hypothetical protein [Eubacteriales bacterium]